jgi:ribose transport system ATP-binding protein
MPLLELRGIEKRFGATVALAGVDFSIEAGEVHALIGENGAGKSTLLNIIAAQRSDVAYIHQELALCPHLSAAENILLGIEPASHGWLQREEMFRQAKTLLEEFGRGDIDPHARTGKLSLADQQVVEICRALATNATIMLMDEPTSSLERPNVERLFRLIRQLRDRGAAIVYVSHFLEEVREIASRYTVLRDGKSIGSGALTDVSDAQLIAMMVGREVEMIGKTTIRTDGEILFRFGELEIRRGEILGIAGIIGSGRTELLRDLFEAIPRAGYLSEDRKREGLALQLSIADNATMSGMRKCARWGWLNLRLQSRQTEEVMGKLRVKAAGPQTRVFRLSGGNQQKVAVGRLLHQDPDILLLDEPARGIDIGSKADIFREIIVLAAQGKAIVMVSSYLPELFAVCDRIAVMTRGRLSTARPVPEWTPESVMRVAVG